MSVIELRVSASLLPEVSLYKPGKEVGLSKSSYKGVKPSYPSDSLIAKI